MRTLPLPVPSTSVLTSLLGPPLRSSERELAVAGRLGLGRELAEYCPEVDPSTTFWINALVERPVCGPEGRKHDPEMLASAKHQCGAWCAPPCILLHYGHGD